MRLPLAIIAALGTVVLLLGACGDSGRPSSGTGRTATPRPTDSPLLGTSTPTPEVVSETVIVAAGDSWAGIAERHGLTLAELLALNGHTEPPTIHPGEVIIVSNGSNAAASTATPASANLYDLPACHSEGRDSCNCSDFDSHASAQWYHDTHDPSDVNQLDGTDQDGVVCETRP